MHLNMHSDRILLCKAEGLMTEIAENFCVESEMEHALLIFTTLDLMVVKSLKKFSFPNNKRK